MRKWIGYSLLTITILIGAASVAQPQVLNSLTRAALQAGTFTLSGIYNFATGIRLPASTTSAPGSGGFLKKDADTGCWQEWKDGTLGWQLCTSRVIPPDCASAMPTLEFGAFCKDQVNKRILMNTGNGNVVLSGVQP